MPIRLKIASTSKDRELVYSLRRKVFVDEEKRFSYPSRHLFDMYDSFDETVNILALEGDSPVGSIRVTNDNPVGLPVFEHYDFGPFVRTLEGKCGSVGWLCTLKKYRRYPGLLMGLFKMAVREMRKAGVRHMIATLHPPVMPMLEKAFGARAVGKEFLSGELKVPMLPIYVDIANFPPGARETFRDPSEIILEESKERRIYKRKEIIFKRGSVGNEAYLVMRGSVRIFPRLESGDESDLRSVDSDDALEGHVLLGQGQVFGEVSLLDAGPRVAFAIPHSREVDLMVWTREELLEQLRSDETKAFEICKLLASRFRKQIEGVSVVPPSSLVARILLDASRQGENEVETSWLARQCGIWLSDLNILLKSWVQKGWIILEEEKNIRVLDAAHLEKQSASNGS